MYLWNGHWIDKLFLSWLSWILWGTANNLGKHSKHWKNINSKRIYIDLLVSLQWPWWYLQCWYIFPQLGDWIHIIFRNIQWTVIKRSLRCFFFPVIHFSYGFLKLFFILLYYLLIALTYIPVDCNLLYLFFLLLFVSIKLCFLSFLLGQNANILSVDMLSVHFLFQYG